MLEYVGGGPGWAVVTFNSLYEMLGRGVSTDTVRKHLTLSILYLRCFRGFLERGVALNFFSFQFSI